MSWRTKFAPTVRAINPTFPKSLKGHCWAAFIRKFSIIWRKSLPGLNLAHPSAPTRRAFIYDGVACTRPAAFGSGGRSHCVQYLSGSFDIPRQFAFGELACRESRAGVETSESRMCACVGAGSWAVSLPVSAPVSTYVGQHGCDGTWHATARDTAPPCAAGPTHTDAPRVIPSLRSVYPQIH